MPRPQRSDLEFVKRATALEQDDGWNDRLSFHPAVFCQLALPYVQPRGNPPVWERRNGPYSLLVRPAMRLQTDGTRAPEYPTGVIPRLVLSWLATEVIRQSEWDKSPEIQLGENLTHFMRGLGIQEITGGRTGSITRLRNALNRLFDAVISAEYHGDPNRDVGRNFVIAEKKQLWWSEGDRNPNQQSLMPSTIWLSETFYSHLRNHPVPLSYHGLQLLQPYGPQALDIYTWLCHRLSYLQQHRMDISWSQLRGQFGSNLADNRFGRAIFRKRFEESLRKVLTVYTAAHVEVVEHGIVLRRSPTHVRPKPLRP